MERQKHERAITRQSLRRLRVLVAAVVMATLLTIATHPKSVALAYGGGSGCSCGGTGGFLIRNHSIVTNTDVISIFNELFA